jgi:Flp pilus assembly pilin Flp
MLRQWIQAILSKDEGQDLTEYTLLLAILALITTGVMTSVGQSGKAVWSDARTTINTAASASGAATANSTPTGGGQPRSDRDGHQNGRD